jgi:hypothetical protein
MSSQTHSPFLDILPVELRLRIYTHLLVASESLKGPVARADTKYDLHTAILRTNKQIHNEARPVFLGKNTFYITSISASPPSLNEDKNEEEEGSGAFEPPLQLADLPLIRHLEIDLLYYPRILRTITDRRTGSWRPMCVGAERYIISLSYLLSAVDSSLLSLKLCADTRRFSDTTLPSRGHTLLACTPGQEDIEEEDGLDIKKLLIGPYVADGSARFRKALKGLEVAQIGLHFDFLESHFDFTTAKDVFCKQSLVDLFGQVLMVRSELRLKAAMQDLGGDEVAGEGSVSLVPRL